MAQPVDLRCEGAIALDRPGDHRREEQREDEELLEAELLDPPCANLER